MKKKYLFAILALIAMAVFFFMKKKPKKTEDPVDVKIAAPVTPKLKTLAVTSSFFTDMEDPDPAIWLGDKSAEKYFSGKFSNSLSDKAEYGITLMKKGSEIPQHEKIKQVRISFQLYSNAPLNKASYVFAVTGLNDKSYEYFKEEIHAVEKKWNSMEIIWLVNATSWGEDATVKIYPWNQGKESFYIDDIKIEFSSEVDAQPGIEIGPRQNYIFDFEPVNDVAHAGNLSKEVAHTGNYSMILSGSDSYSGNIIKRFSEVASDTVKFISTSVWLYPKEDNPIVTLVVSIEKPDATSISWQGKSSDKMNLKKNEWHKINFRADLREIKTSADDIVKIYLWNKKGGTVYADDLEIVYGDIPNPKGSSAGVMMNLTGDPVGQKEKNKAPFPQTFFSAASPISHTSVFLIEGDGEKKGELNPENLILSGNFSGHPVIQDDIFIADEKNWSLFSWCESEKQFKQIFSSKTTGAVTGKVILTGFFDDIKQEEIILIDTTGKTATQTIRFSGSSEFACGKKSTDEIKLNTSSTEISGFDIHGNTWKIVAGNFTGDGRDEIVFVSTNGQWNLFEKKKSGFGVASSGNILKGTILSAHTVAAGSNHEKLLIFNEQNQKLDYCMLDFGSGNNNCSVTEFKDKSFLAYYSIHSGFLSGSFEKPSDQELFYLDKAWRFDLKKVKLTTDGFIIESQIDFEQPDANRNPKYYEYTKLLGGKFFATGTDYLLVLMRNCRDADFDGKSCNEFEEVEGMPSGFMFYQYKPAQ